MSCPVPASNRSATSRGPGVLSSHVRWARSAVSRGGRADDCLVVTRPSSPGPRCRGGGVRDQMRERSRCAEEAEQLPRLCEASLPDRPAERLLARANSWPLRSAAHRRERPGTRHGVLKSQEFSTWSPSPAAPPRLVLGRVASFRTRPRVVVSCLAAPLRLVPGRAAPSRTRPRRVVSYPAPRRRLVPGRAAPSRTRPRRPVSYPSTPPRVVPATPRRVLPGHAASCRVRLRLVVVSWSAACRNESSLVLETQCCAGW
jgi:hypothetical protein